MENASKALIIAGSVLLSLLIISALVLMFNKIGQLKRNEADIEGIQKIEEYNKQIENFYRTGLYGSEILSLANLVEDYNKRLHELEEYEEIKLTVEFKTVDYKNFAKSPATSKELIQGFQKLENEAQKVGNKTYYGKTVKTLDSMKDSQIKDLLIANGEQVQDLSIINIRDYLSNSAKKDIEQYSELNLEVRNFKNRKFQKPLIIYNNYGRITNITVKEIGI